MEENLYLKPINLEDCEKEYEALQKIPAGENGFQNKYASVSKEEFVTTVIPALIKSSRGEDIPEGKVPDTYFFLWDNDKIVGLFKVRHYLNEKLRNGAGHIGFGIIPEERRKGYASKGLALAIEELKKVIREDEIYMSCEKDNEASLKAQLNNGAYIHHSDNEHYYTRINLKKTDIIE